MRDIWHKLKDCTNFGTKHRIEMNTMTSSNTVIQEAETLHRKLALTADAVVGHLEAYSSHNDDIYAEALYEQLIDNRQAFGRLLDYLKQVCGQPASTLSDRSESQSTEANKGYRPDYQASFALLDWLNTNRSVLEGKDLEWFVSMCKTNPVLKPVYEQLFNGDPSDIAPSNPKRPSYNRALDLLEWLNANRSEITEQDREWIRQMNESSNAFKQICLQLFGTEFLTSHNTPAGAQQ